MIRGAVVQIVSEKNGKETINRPPQEIVSIGNNTRER